MPTEQEQIDTLRPRLVSLEANVRDHEQLIHEAQRDLATLAKRLNELMTRLHALESSAALGPVSLVPTASQIIQAIRTGALCLDELSEISLACWKEYRRIATRRDTSID